ncbi:DNA mismatch endonuclease (patch repair protein) [Arthrobacter stackebrandtii]|uniref:Very short patch repair endonuclease n=1 Tax=Arthrobacter stackebrandtii TaxID=272161 RepID=A0ABS4YUQ9_9MICC|nr:very short patch repair endonuclease [Arthrobacter stackebrandtii]MBP2412532.1 DNA mismatch endonuclease (patch repair protein) [Arthrobacter stackebrandtii]PYH02281.1 very short patch repair endonuclease [Arthrobacter stackebrandtii]
MVDSLTREQRHKVMSHIHSKDTKPEMLVRRMLFAEGYRYRLHAADLPGTPDLVFRRRRVAVFVNGCFWHSHSCPNGTHKPATNAEFWEAKRNRTVERDGQALTELANRGWTAVTVWECELRSLNAVADSLHRALGPPRL